MFGFGRRRSGRDLIETLHGAVVAASREPSLYGEDGLPDTVEGRFEALVLHLVLAFRRLRALPPPAADVAQDLVDLAFGHLEVALRESGIGDFGVPKRMKKIATVFYERSAAYDAALDAGDETALAAELSRHLDAPPARLARVARHALAVERGLGARNLDSLLRGAPLTAAEVPS